MLAWLLLLLLGLLCSSVNANHILYVWGGSAKGDFLATIDYDRDSPYYGDVLHKTVLPDTGTVKSTGNEPHHMHLAGGNKWLVTGGLMSFAQGSDEIFVWTLDPETRFPSFKYSLDVIGGCTDEFIPYTTSPTNTQFLVTMMCNSTGGYPGHIVWIDVASGEWEEWTKPGEDLGLFNPHGGHYASNVGLVATDYVFPLSLFTDNFVFRDSLHHFNTDGTLNTIIEMPTVNSGYMDFKFITPRGQGVTCSLQENVIYLIEPLAEQKVTPIFDLFTVNGGVPVLSAGIMSPSKRGDRLFMSYGLRYVVLFGYDPQDPRQLEKLHVFDFCAKDNGLVEIQKVCSETNNMPGTHWISLSPEEDRFFVLNYFVVVGNVNLPGSRTVHSFAIASDFNSFTLETNFKPVISFGGAIGAPHMGSQVSWHSNASALAFPSLLLAFFLTLRALLF